MDYLQHKWRRWRLKYTTLLIVSLVIFFVASSQPQVISLIQALSLYGQWGAFIAGLFFVSAYTVVPAGFVLYELGNYINPWQIALFGGLGAMVGDYIIFRFIRDQLYDELNPHFRWLRWFRSRRKQRSLLLKILMPALGALIIISPFPDEIGVGMMGITRMGKVSFLALTYVLNATGIFILALLARSM